MMEAAQSSKSTESSRSTESIGQVYLFLGRCFTYPEEGFCEVMKDKSMQDEIKGLMGRLPFEVNFKGIPSPSLPQDELGSEYINVFDLNPLCPLYEHHYRSSEQSRRDILEELLRFYEHFEIKLNDKEKDFPDHLMAELEFMAFLSKKEAVSIDLGRDPEPYRRAQLDFLERHLKKWIRPLNERIQKSVRDPFYSSASSLLTDFVEEHAKYLT